MVNAARARAWFKKRCRREHERLLYQNCAAASGAVNAVFEDCCALPELVTLSYVENRSKEIGSGQITLGRSFELVSLNKEYRSLFAKARQQRLGNGRAEAFTDEFGTALAFDDFLCPVQGWESYFQAKNI